MCFITDVFSRMIIGWRVAAHMRTSMVLDSIEMARLPVGIATRICGDIRCWIPAYLGLRYGERLAEIGAVPLDRDRRRQLRR